MGFTWVVLWECVYHGILNMSSNRTVRAKCKDLRGKSKEELLKQSEALKQEYATLRVTKLTNATSAKVSKIKVVRKSIAGINIVIRQTTKQNLKKYYKDRKYKPLDMRRKRTRQIRKMLTKHERSIKSAKQIARERRQPKRIYAVKD